MKSIFEIFNNNDCTILPNNMQNDILKIVRQNFLEAITEIEGYLINCKSIDYSSNLRTVSDTQILMIETYCKINKLLRSLTHQTNNNNDLGV